MDASDVAKVQKELKMRNCNSAFDSQFCGDSSLTADMVYMIQKENEGYRFLVWSCEDDSIDDCGSKCINFDFGDRNENEIIEFLRNSEAREVV